MNAGPSDAHAALAERLSAAFAGALRWLDVDEGLWRAREDPRAWSVGEVLEHVVLADQYLLVLADKIAAKSARRLAEGARPPAETPRFDHLEALAARSTAWPAPEHMLPGGRATRSEIRTGLERDRARALALLRAHPHGEGSLHAIRFSPVDAHLDLYQFLGLIEMHLRRHLAQIERSVLGARR